MTDSSLLPDVTATSDDRSLALIVDGSRMLAEARDLFAVRNVRALAVGATAYAKARGEVDALRQASTIVILASVRLGEELDAGQADGTIALPGHPILGRVEDRPATLRDLGISADLASASQKLAADPAAVDAYLTRRDVMPTMRGALRAVAGGEPVDALVAAVDADAAAAQREDRVREMFGHLERAGLLLSQVVPLAPEEVEGVRLHVELMAAELPPAPTSTRGGKRTTRPIEPPLVDSAPANPPCFAAPDLYRAHQTRGHHQVTTSVWVCYLCNPELAPVTP